MRQRVVEVADPYNSPPPEIPRRSTLNQLLGTFARKLASLKQYGLVRLASQAVLSPNSAGFYHCDATIESLIIKIS